MPTETETEEERKARFEDLDKKTIEDIQRWLKLTDKAPQDTRKMSLQRVLFLISDHTFICDYEITRCAGYKSDDYDFQISVNCVESDEFDELENGVRGNSVDEALRAFLHVLIYSSRNYVQNMLDEDSESDDDDESDD